MNTWSTSSSAAFGWLGALFFPGWHSQQIWNEAAQEQHLWRVLPAYYVPEEAWHLEGSAVDWVWVWERTGLWGRGQRVVLPPIQRDVQSLLRLIWILCHVSCWLFVLLLEIWRHLSTACSFRRFPSADIREGGACVSPLRQRCPQTIVAHV